LIVGPFGRLLFFAGFRAIDLGKRGEGNLLAKVRFHELGKLGLEFFRRRKWRCLIQDGKVTPEVGM
jgi:hypothetical protein